MTWTTLDIPSELVGDTQADYAAYAREQRPLRKARRERIWREIERRMAVRRETKR